MILNKIFDQQLKKLYEEKKIDVLKDKLKYIDINEIFKNKLNDDVIDLEDIKVLVYVGVDVNMQNKDGNTALMLAAMKKKLTQKYKQKQS